MLYSKFITSIHMSDEMRYFAEGVVLTSRGLRNCRSGHSRHICKSKGPEKFAADIEKNSNGYTELLASYGRWKCRKVTQEKLIGLIKTLTARETPTLCFKICCGNRASSDSSKKYCKEYFVLFLSEKSESCESS